MASFHRVERAWRDLSRRLGLLTSRPIGQVLDGVLPVMIAAQADFADAERPLYIGAAQQAAVAGEHGAGVFVANVPAVLLAVIPTIGASFQICTENVLAFDPTQNNTTERQSQLRLLGGRIGACRVVDGVPNAFPTISGTGFAPYPIDPVSPALLASGDRIVLQNTTVNQETHIVFVWRELEF
jgi:hypothetical protein